MPRTVTRFCAGTSNSIPSGGRNVTGCEYPTCSSRSDPLRAARYPTPTISRRFSNPLVTPSTMLAKRVRVSPCSERCRRSSEGRSTRTVPFSMTIRMSAWKVCSRVPLGPFTDTRDPSTPTSTPEGMVMGCLPIRDISLPRLPDVRENFPAHAKLLGLAVGQHSSRSGQDSDAQPAQHPGYLFLVRIDSPPRRRHPLQAAHGALPIGAVLQADDDPAILAFPLHSRLGDVSLTDQDLGDALLQLGGRHHHLVLVGHRGVADPGEHVRHRVGHDHVITTSPRRLRDAGDLALMGKLAKAQAAQHEPAKDRPWTPAAGTPRVGPRLEFPAGPPLLLDQRLLRHPASPLAGDGRGHRPAGKREAQGSQQRPGLVVVLGRGHDRDVPASVEGLGVEAAEVPDPRERGRQKPVQELPHAVSPKGDLGPDWHTGSELEVRDGLPGPSHGSFLPGDRSHVHQDGVQQLAVADGVAHAGVHGDLLEAGHPHAIGDAELALQGGHHLVQVARLEPRDVGFLGCSSHRYVSASQCRQIRARTPPSRRCPILVGLPQFLHTSMTFDRSMNISFWMMPPCWSAWPLRDRLPPARVWAVARATASTMTRFFFGRTFTTRPRFPRSFPPMTCTSSFFRMSVGMAKVPPAQAK